jgi:hypothetical protein
MKAHKLNAVVISDGAVPVCFAQDPAIYFVKGTIQNVPNIGKMLIVSAGSDMFDTDDTFLVTGTRAVGGKHVYVIDYFDIYPNVSRQERTRSLEEFGIEEEEWMYI